MRKVYRTLMLLFGASRFVFAQEGCIPLMEVDSIAKAEKYFEDVDPDTLVIFDVDAVLTIPSDPALNPASFDVHKEIYKEMSKDLSKEKRHLLNHLILASSPQAVLEDKFISLIRKIQKKGARTIAFTAAKTGSVGPWVEDFPKWRSRELRKLGFDFSFSFPQSFSFKELSPASKDCPEFKEGILYSCGSLHKKGDVLQVFLHAVKMTPKKIIVVDDKLKNIVSIQEAVEKHHPDIDFQAIHYHGVHLFKRAVTDSTTFKNKIYALLEKVSKHEDS